MCVVTQDLKFFPNQPTMDTAVNSNPIPRSKNCKTCYRKVISNFSSLKNCDDCRRKNRLKKAQQSEKTQKRCQRIEFFAENHGRIPSEDKDTRWKVRSGMSLVNSNKLLHESNGRVALKGIKDNQSGKSNKAI